MTTLYWFFINGRTFFSLMNFNGKNVFITGASGCLGGEIALSFAKNSVNNLIITGRNAGKLNQIVENCKVFCKNTFSINGDLSKVEDIDKIVEFVEKTTNNQLDIFVSCHGVPDDVKKHNVNSSEFSIDSFNHIMMINFESNVRLTNMLARILQKDGSIVYITSINNGKTLPQGSAYSSSKAALSMFMKCAALDLSSRKIRVNSVAPGLMNTSFHHHHYESYEKQTDELNKIGKQLPCKHLPSIIGVSNTVLFLCSEMAKDITGIEQVVDCGHSLLMSSA